ncbi:hypothetical protein I4F81_005877 [Pyropia yezoensis]|uniref:Uncharacterized protein n=1 Tax=Pyropia yezoensis TaxID=2788 RepID=A0ACC3C035_PYRYE|nr:hypothetical protein I4F81_005877 [Neopyropia yezoensis]
MRSYLTSINNKHVAKEFPRPSAGAHASKLRKRNAEARPNPRRLVNTIPNDPKLDFDPVLPLLRQMVNELRAKAALPAKLLRFTRSLNRAPTLDDLTVWLHRALAALGVSPHPGTLYLSYSYRSGEATALCVISVPLVAVAAMLGHKDNDTGTAIPIYVADPAPFTFAALRLCGRWLRPSTCRVRRATASPSCGTPA